MNDLAPLLMAAFVGLSATHAVATYPHARNALTHHHSVPVLDGSAAASPTAPRAQETPLEAEGPRAP